MGSGVRVGVQVGVGMGWMVRVVRRGGLSRIRKILGGIGISISCIRIRGGSLSTIIIKNVRPRGTNFSPGFGDYDYLFGIGWLVGS